MNGAPHIHQANVEKHMPFPHFSEQWYVVYGDQQVWLGTTYTWFIRSRNPLYWTAEERKQRVAAATAKAIARHDRASKVAAAKENAKRDTERELELAARSSAPPIERWVGEEPVAVWPSERRP